MLFAIPFPDLSPTLVEIPLGFMTLAIRWYALAYIVGIVIGYLIIARAIARPELWPEHKAPMDRQALEDLLTWMILGIIIGGRLGYVLFYERDYFLANPADIPKVWMGGMAFHGGFLGVVVAGLVFARRRGIPIPQLADALALATPAGLMLGRVANFINAELWGRPTDLPWGVIFPGEAAQNCPGVIGPCARHPSQLYEAGLEGLVLGLLLLSLAFGRNWLKRPGQICGLFLIGYGAARFFVEFFRVADAQFISPDNPLGHVAFLGEFGLSMGQLLSVPMILVGVVIVMLARRDRRSG
ncbi:prolipoprotein diacylglyceryl transferase [Alphaproteobacteria bacterium GH1-50]|uniref:Phosphatidylglycerol--prolipoprotein diacylglyceryl transferase n=1 Tax=Kangsaoukella pontilimi TaxID=2691042 RepID=A0A7C9IHI7_9RHOB|nr:prolipoprotein diacylglyceryl transferase [Kangsaoukella pontilimi]MXQ08647.1 prolipoprotein diacylglyceryl transferase [Kangsaoukella pontilimi]